jgi:hypothetical protein
MKSDNYLQLLLSEYTNKELSHDDLKSTLIHFAKLYHKEKEQKIRINQDLKSRINLLDYFIEFYDLLSLKDLIDKREKTRSQIQEL